MTKIKLSGLISSASLERELSKLEDTDEVILETTVENLKELIKFQENSEPEEN